MLSVPLTQKVSPSQAAEEDLCTSTKSCAQLQADAGGDGWPTNKGDHQICGEADVGGVCYDASTWQEATTICLSSGARLCTVEELEADETRGTGCQHNSKLVWSSNKGGCGPAQHAVVVGNSAMAGRAGMATACHDDTMPNAVSCCGDDEARIAANPLSCVDLAVTDFAAHPPPPPPSDGSSLVWESGHTPCISGKSCEDLQAQTGEWPAGTYTPNVCGESDAGFSTGCSTETWLEAESICFEVGARLCTPRELFMGTGAGTGCGHNSVAVWTSEACETGHTQHQFTDADGTSIRQCADDSTPTAVRCCADAEARSANGGRSARMGLMTCDLYASEEGKCTSAKSCQELGDLYGAAWRPTIPRGVSLMARWGSADICGEADKGLGPGGTDMCLGGVECTGEGAAQVCTPRPAVSWQEAEGACLNIGARLCTVEEIEADEARGTGCNADRAMVWTSDDIGCAAGQHVVVIGSSNNLGRLDDLGFEASTDCRNDAGGDAEAVRCCADAVVGEACTMAAPHGPPPPATPPPPIAAVCQVAWNSDAHSTCLTSCAPCEACFTTVNHNMPECTPRTLHRSGSVAAWLNGWWACTDAAFGGNNWEGTCGCFETARGGPPCQGGYDGCAPWCALSRHPCS